MAELRMIALVMACGGAGCGRAEAVPPAVIPPAGWLALPALAEAAASALDGFKLGDVLAWGDPAKGCYATWLAVRGHASADEIVDGLRAAGVTSHDVVKADGAGTLALGFARGAYRGRLRATLATEGEITALACFWNEREPAACAAACTGVIAGIGGIR